MNDQKKQLFNFFQLRIISADNPPQLPKLYVKIFLVGPVRSYIYKTSCVSYKNCSWKTGWINFSPVRGAKIHFELFNDNVGVDRVYSIGDFDPKTTPINHNGEIIQVPLTKINGSYQNKKEPSFLNIAVNYQPRNIEIDKSQNLILETPFYITVEPKKYIRLSDLTPNYRFPFELSAFLVDDNNKTITCVDSATREGICAWHSGVNICSSYSSLTPAIRIDPRKAETSFRYIYIVLSSTNFIPLKYTFNGIDKQNNTISDDAFDGTITIWKTDESFSIYSKSSDLKIRESGYGIEPSGQFPVKMTDNTCFNVVLFGYRLDGKIIFFNPNYCLPNNVTPPFQEPNEVFSLAFQQFPYQLYKSSIPCPQISSKFEGINSIRLPLYLPRSISLMLKKEFNPTIIAKVPFLKNHSLKATCLNKDMKPILICDSDSSDLYSGVMTYISGKITIDLEKVPIIVTSILFTIYGNDALNTELLSKKQKENEAFDIKVIVNSTELIKTPLNYSRTKNSLLWFSLFRDVFSGWSILYLRNGISSSSLDDCNKQFIQKLRSIMTF